MGITTFATSGKKYVRKEVLEMTIISFLLFTVSLLIALVCGIGFGISCERTREQNTHNHFMKRRF